MPAANDPASPPRQRSPSESDKATVVEHASVQLKCRLLPSESDGMRLVPGRGPAHECTHVLLDIARYRASSCQRRCPISGLAYWPAACLATSLDEVRQKGTNGAMTATQDTTVEALIYSIVKVHSQVVNGQTILVDGGANLTWGA